MVLRDRAKSVEGELIEMKGYAYTEDESQPGKLTVHLDGVPMDAPYWILALGDEDGVSYYPRGTLMGQAAVCGSPSGHIPKGPNEVKPKSVKSAVGIQFVYLTVLYPRRATVLLARRLDQLASTASHSCAYPLIMSSPASVNHTCVPRIGPFADRSLFLVNRVRPVEGVPLRTGTRSRDVFRL